MVEEFNPSKAIVLTELTTREKEKYYHLLLLNNAKFTRDSEGRYIANVRLLAPGVRKNESTNSGNNIVPEKKKKETSNYALIFQERLTKLRENGFINVNILGNNSQFDYNIYPRFTALIAFNNDTVKPKLRPLLWVMKYIEDVYDSRFAYEKHEVEKGEEGTPSFDLILMIFPVFVVRRLGTNTGLKSLVDSICWDLLFSIHHYRQDYLEIELFARFLQEYYDHNDLLFFLYVRSVISKSLHINWKMRWQKLDGPGRQPAALWMSYREAMHISGIVFASGAGGGSSSSQHKEFLSLLQSQMVGSWQEATGQDTRRIDITEFLHLSVVGYHQSQLAQQTGSVLLPIPGQIPPPTPVPLPPSGPVFDLPRYPNNTLNTPNTPSYNPTDPVYPADHMEEEAEDQTGGQEGQGGAEGVVPNAFEQLQHDREEEFVVQLAAGLQEMIPSDVFEYIGGLLRERLHQTVTLILADKEIFDLESLDAALLEILQLHQLRTDMETFRDEILTSLFANMLPNNSNEGHTGGDEEDNNNNNYNNNNNNNYNNNMPQ